MNYFKKIPKVDKILEYDTIKNLIEKYGKKIVKKFIDNTLNELKENIASGDISDIDFENLLQGISSKVEQNLIHYFSPKLMKVINATGIVLHTNMGRSPISEIVLENLKDIAGNYSNLEFNLETGKRGIRYANIVKYLQDLTGAEDTIVVNNNAAAVLLCLSAIAKSREVLISRGELIEIGGSFRIPEVMEQSGAILREVGATNKTHNKDYINAINENTALILKAHTSNYRIVGFTQSVEIEDLVEIGKKYNLPVMYDLGSGSFIDLSIIGLPDEPTVPEVVKKGVDLVTFSGDKLLGGPQAGIILGKKKYIEILKKHPLNRALRIGKFTLAALEPVLKAYFNEQDAINNVLTLKLITAKLEELEKRARKIYNGLKDNEFFKIKIEQDFSYVGGGAFPMNKIPTFILSLQHTKLSPASIDSLLRKTMPPIIGRIKNELFILDMRTIFDNQVETVINIINNINA